MSERFGADVLAHVSKLARISLTPEESEHLGADLARIVDYLAVLERVPVDAGLAGVAKPVSLRADEPRPSLTLAEFSKNAPEIEDGAFVVPAFLGAGKGGS